MKWLRRWLGLEDILDLVEDIRDKQSRQKLTLDNIETNVRRLNTNVSVSNSAIGQVVAKLNPILSVPEDDPARVAQSKEMGEKIIKRMQDEAKVLEHYNLTPKAEQ